MAKSDIEQLAEAFDTAVSLEGPAREDFLKTFARDHPDMDETLRGMILADSSERDVLRSWVETETGHLSQTVDDPWIGRQLGVWKIVERLGSGGMGAVFLAQRSDEQFNQDAAIKVMGTQLLSEGAAERFRLERQILANLSHPNIATLIDGGSTELKLPYLVMEYVEGLPIDAYCQANRLDVVAIMDLFQKVCAAVDFAHRNLVVHRDLKPDNILVSPNAEPKLLDFGVAKLIEPLEHDDVAVSDGRQYTQAGSRALTLAYASPEQVRGEPVSTATDVYALGVLLYRLLTGQSPYGETSASPRDMEDAILHAEPSSPGSTLSRSRQPGSPGSSPAPSVYHFDLQRRRAFGDLNNIVLKCLQKAPSQRYSTAKELSDDIGRYLRKEPVEARAPHWFYVFGKFCRRHVAVIGTASAFFITIAGLATFFTLRLAEERNAAQRSAAAAQLASSEARQVSDFLSQMFQSASPHTSQGEVVTAVDLLNSDVERIEALNGQPVLQSNLYRIMGYSFTELGDFDTGLVLHQRSMDVLNGVDDVDPLLIAENLSGLAEVQRNLELNEESIANRFEVLRLMEAYKGADHADTLYAKVRLGTSLGQVGRADEALVQLREAIDISRGVEDGHSDVTLDVMGVAAVMLSNLGRYREAELLNADAIKYSESVLGPMNPNTVIRTLNAGVYLREQFKLKEALATQHEANKRGETVWPLDTPIRIYGVQQEAITLQFLGRFDEARALLDEVEPAILNGRGENSLEYAFHLATLAGWYLDQARYQEALGLFQQSLEIAVNLNGPDNRRAVEASIGIGQVLAGQGELAAATDALEDALERQSGIRVHTRLIAERTLASVLSRLGKTGEASALFERVLAEKQSHVGGDSAALVPYLIECSAHARRSGRDDEALDYASQAHQLATQDLPADNWIVALASAEYAKALQANGRIAEARPLEARARETLARIFGSDQPALRD